MSYSRLIENYVINPPQSSYQTKCEGRMITTPIPTQIPRTTSYGFFPTIGRQIGYKSQRFINDEYYPPYNIDWFLRVFFDGTALFKPDMLHSLRYNHVRRGILRLINTEFNIVLRSPDGTQTLQRKRLAPNEVTCVTGVSSFVEYLRSNRVEEEVTV